MGQSSKRITIGYIDNNTRIATEDKCFVIEQLKKNKKDEQVWVGEHYFSFFDDLLRYYVRIYLQQESKGKQDSTLLQLLDRVTTLQTKIEDTGKKLQEAWAAHHTYYDPPKENA